MKTTVLNTKESVIEYLEGLSNDELVQVHNTYCDVEQYEDDRIYENDEDFFDTHFGSNVMDAVRAVSYGEYNYTDSYVQFNGYANLESFNDPSKYVDLGAIADSILESPEDYDIELEEVEEEEEEEEGGSDLI